MNLRQKAQQLSVTVRIGKSQVSQGMIQEIKNQLKVKKMVKIKMLKAALQNKPKKELIEEIAQTTMSQVIMHLGNVVVLYKP